MSSNSFFTGAILAAACLWPSTSGTAYAQEAAQPIELEGNRTFAEIVRDAFEGDGQPWRLDAAIVVPGSGLAGGGGVRSLTSDTRPFGVSVDGLWSIHNYRQLTVRAGLLAGRSDLPELTAADSSVTSSMDSGDRFARGLVVFLEHRYRHLPGLSLFGADDGVAVRTDFGVRRDTTEVVAQWKGARSFGMGARAGALSTRLLTGADDKRPNTSDRFGDLLDAGRPATTRYVTAGVGVVVDRRIDTPVVRAGWLLSMAAFAFRSTTEGAASFTRLTVDARAYQPLLSTRHVLALRLVASSDRASTGGSVPYFLQQSLGGSSSLRGFSSYRFRGERLLSATVESRWDLFRRVEIVPFVDVGRVANAPLDQTGTGLLAAAGLGARVRHDGRIVGRIEVAYGREGARIVLAIGPPF